MPKHGKKYRKATEGTEQIGLTVEQAVASAVEKAYAKFDETVDVAINLGVDPKYSDQMIRGAVTLPNGLGKEIRVACFVSGEKEAEAKEAGADFVGGDDLVAKVKDGWLDFDKAIATPDMMAKVGQIGRVLGPRGLMPNAKTGTVTFDVASAVKEVKAGRVEFKVDKAGVLHAPIGKVSFGAEKLLENLKALLETVYKLKPSSAKGTYMKAVAVATTMGPGFKIDPLAARKYSES
ncbi:MULTISPECIES: 50S ribosomal protein L1 [unclassified Maridesulfovibrio]|uniref:50S ribosomal protein L1 n=1 Tax=unclassified Maridesulfovibrio TaxID=2794999 RepID=UPI003B41A8D7